MLQGWDKNLRCWTSYETKELETLFTFDAEGGFQEAAGTLSSCWSMSEEVSRTMCPHIWQIG